MPVISTRSFLLAALAWGLALPCFAQSGTLARIASERTIVMGYIDGAAPFSSAGSNGQPLGYSIDLCRAIAEGIGAQLKIADLKTRWVALTVQDRLDAVRTKRVDLECSTTTWTLSRQALVDFSLITFVDGANIVTLAESAVSRIEDFSGKRIAVLSGTTTEKVLREALARHKVKAEVVEISSRPQGVEMVEQAKVDGFASDRTTLIGLVAPRSDRTRFRLLDQDLSVEAYALALPRDDHDFRLAVDRVLAGLYRSGGIKPIYDRWLGLLGAPSLLLNATYFIQGIAE
ncbi:MAG TPA: amino acid ABC transporter substrate-binding protein [Burkholderiales bacterium]|nr:amino acid ABC transporter substrate-binding protein [Burkholderiales bacterium]